MKVYLRLAMLAVIVAASAGCGNGGPAEVPKNPVPMEKPGATATPGGGKGGALPNQQGVQPLK